MDSFEPRKIEEWENWLKENHNHQKSIWLILAKKDSELPYIELSEIIDTALCYGWIDSLPNKVDEFRYKLRMSPRNPKSNWSRVNKEKIERLIAQSKMAPAGLEMVSLAKKSGTWTALEIVEDLILPNEMSHLFESNPVAATNYEAFPRSTKRAILEWIYSAKKPETMTARIKQTVYLASKNIRANQYSKKA